MTKPTKPTKLRAESSSEQRDIKLISDPNEWPRWPVLPLKRRNRSATEPNYLGFIIASNARPIKVYLGSIFQLKSGRLPDVVADFPVEEYPTIDDLITEWKVD